ncbi:MAG TPA: phospholipid carrier-dependent glycosyltransferase [Patescibacteria group bacterium]|nr:phospholipid carrier-dependent glycosyltransferase [Patescibacteria group bacterium]
MLNKYFTPTLLLWIILIGAFVVRLHGFNNPVADWHSWRQADTSSVSRNFIKYGFDLLHPRMNNISNVQSGMENPQGYFFAEFPIYNATQAGLFSLFHFFTIEEWGRLVTIFSSLLSIVFLFLLVRKFNNSSLALITAFVFAFLPYNIYYGRVILPDPSMSMAVLGTIYFFAKSIGQRSKIKDQRSKFTKSNYINLFISLLFAMLALLLKPFAAFFFLPLVFLAWNAYGFKIFKQWKLWLFAILAVIPLALWRIWMTQYPAGIPSNIWLFNGNGIRFRPAFFRWMLYERLTKLFLGFFGLLPLLLGIFVNWKNAKNTQALFYWSFLISSILYVCVVATGNVQHDYYQIAVMPTIALFVGLGSYYFLNLKFANKAIRSILLIIVFVGAFVYSWGTVGHYFDIDNHAIVTAGEAVNQLTPANAKIIAPYGGDSSFLYQTNRQGWASFERSLPDLIKLGANYLVIVNPPESDRVNYAKDYRIIKSTQDYILVDLNHKA